MQSDALCRASRVSYPALTWVVLPITSTLSPLGTDLTKPCIHPDP